jgi:asparagine synthase (glutamine-hydrolysing)
MCGIAGWINYKEDLQTEENLEILKNMQDALSRRGPDEAGSFTEKHAGLVHRRLAVVDISGGKQPMQKTHNGATFTLVYNGELYNADELREQLISLGHKFSGGSDTEVLLSAFIQWEAGCLDKLNGIFAFAVWNDKKKSLFCARDPMGVKPFFFKKTNRGIVFASELKSLFKNPLCPALLDKNGVNQIFLLAPGRIPSSGVYRDILELRAGEYLVCTTFGIKKRRYFKLKARRHTENLEQTKTHLRELILDSIDRQLVADVPLACFLSGGLDSSIITYAAAEKYRRENKTLTTFSVDFKDNDKNFERNAFQQSTDTEYIQTMADFSKTEHKFVTLENTEVVAALENAALARDLGGMADIDSSLLLFCKEVKKTHTVCLSGECADEILGGYPWFFTKTEGEIREFPWAHSLSMRKGLLNKNFLVKKPENYIRALIKKTVRETDTLAGESKQDRYMRRMFMLNLNWFMQTLLDRKDRMSMYSGLEVRVPFCDYRLVEYAFNLPWKYKSLGGREKGLVREAFKDILPEKIIHRKKNPYPKTFDPEFLKQVKENAVKAVNGDGLISRLVDKDYFNRLAEDQDPNACEPWYGQLMRLPQVFAWICQLDFIFREYCVKLCT